MTAIMNYNGTIYHYVYNLQGDVIALLDDSNSIVVEYKYDAWGALLGKTGTLSGTLGTLNPFRYRGYVYDEETKLYYLRSRYYNPEWGRFISADALMGKTRVLFSHNLFAYCEDEPIRKCDNNGNEAGDYAVIQTKLLYTSLAHIYLSSKNYEISDACFYHFLFGNGKLPSKELLCKIGEAVRDSKEFRNRIIQNAPHDRTVWIDNPTKSIEMHGDLFFAVQHIRPISICIKTPLGIIGLSYFKDRYDFDFRNEDDERDWLKEP